MIDGISTENGEIMGEMHFTGPYGFTRRATAFFRYLTTVSLTDDADSTVERGLRQPPSSRTRPVLSALGAVWLLSEQPVLTRKSHQLALKAAVEQHSAARCLTPAHRLEHR